MLEAHVKGVRERVIILAHQTAVFNRIDGKQFKGVDHYLKKLRKPKRRADQSAEVARMFDRMIKRQEGEFR